jgi:hypothetical protein
MRRNTGVVVTVGITAHTEAVDRDVERVGGVVVREAQILHVPTGLRERPASRHTDVLQHRCLIVAVVKLNNDRIAARGKISLWRDLRREVGLRIARECQREHLLRACSTEQSGNDGDRLHFSSCIAKVQLRKKSSIFFFFFFLLKKKKKNRKDKAGAPCRCAIGEQTMRTHQRTHCCRSQRHRTHAQRHQRKKKNAKKKKQNDFFRLATQQQRRRANAKRRLASSNQQISTYAICWWRRSHPIGPHLTCAKKTADFFFFLAESSRNGTKKNSNACNMRFKAHKIKRRNAHTQPCRIDAKSSHRSPRVRCFFFFFFFFFPLRGVHPARTQQRKVIAIESVRWNRFFQKNCKIGEEIQRK